MKKAILLLIIFPLYLLAQKPVAKWTHYYGVTESSNNVSQWTSLIGAYSVAQATENQQPTYSESDYTITGNGTSDNLTLASTDFNPGTSDFTWSIWLKAPATQTGNEMFVVKFDNSGNNSGFKIFQTTQYLSCVFRHGGNNITGAADMPVVPSTINNYTVRFDRSGYMSQWINYTGDVDSTDISAGVAQDVAPSNPLTFFKDFNASGYWDGSLISVMYFDYKITDAQIDSIYQAGYLRNAYFIDPTTGDNDSTGRGDSTAWADFTNVRTNALYGDSIFIKGGETLKDTLAVPDSILYFSSYDTAGLGRPKISGSNTAKSVFNVANKTGVQIVGLELDSATVAHIDSVGKFCRIARNRFLTTAGWGLRVYGDSSFIDHNKFIAGENGLYIDGLNCLVVDSYADTIGTSAVRFDTSGYMFNTVIQNSEDNTNAMYIASAQQVWSAANIFDVSGSGAGGNLAQYSNVVGTRYANTFSKDLVGEYDKYQIDRGIDIQQFGYYGTLRTKINFAAADFLTFDGQTLSVSK